MGVDIGDCRIVVYEEGRAALLPGDLVEFGIMPGAVHFFRRVTGAAIAEKRLATR